ncbi:efflux RND transporter periplasmic adaptor subunit [Algoriphagus algorifonticola]|uniref:efflux RND transporter periplasmic adaptor subunit n=1 Tax=Algoriphagus algorifonticola TaxID=2593007 RepID=UPI00119EE9AE|nr:efflux RND transporter periplasmic adaptor subunit [Algoriphagus algorifonticola]
MKISINQITPIMWVNQAGKALIVILILVLAGCSGGSSGSENPTEKPVETGGHEDEAHGEEGHDEENIAEITPAQFKAAGIQLGKVEMRNLSSTLRVNGLIDAPPQNLINISAPMGGFVRKTDLLQGMAIKKGQLLVTLEHPDYVTIQQEYVQSKNQLAYMELEYKRQEELSRENVSALKIFQQTQAEYKNLQAQVKGLEEKLAILGINATNLTEDKISRYIHLYSPVTGYVSEVNVNLGKYVNSTDAMFELIDAKHLHAELTVYEKDLPKIAIGQKVRFTIPNDPSREYKAEVYLMGKKIESDRSLRIHAHLEDEDNQLVPGMYIQAVIEAAGNQVPSVPDEALVQFEGNYFIYLDEGKKMEDGQELYAFEMTQVQTGVSENGFTEILLPAGLDMSSTSIVTKGAFSLLGKMKNSEEEGHAH